MTITTNNKLCTVYGEYQGTTHIRKLFLFFSLKKRKFIKPSQRIGDRVSGNYTYRLYPGIYVLIGYRKASNEQPPRSITAQLINIDNNCNVNYGKAVVITFENFEWLDKQDIPQMLKDIANWAPNYHSLPSPDFDKIYSEEDVQKLLDMIEKELTISEGEEHE